MQQDFYTIQEVANLLGLHVKTVRNYVRDGRLKSTRIGKQYRIPKADLEAFTGGAIGTPAGSRAPRHIDVSSIVQVDAIDPESAARLTNTLLAAIKGRREVVPLRLETIYDDERARLKLVISGSIESTQTMLAMIEKLVGESHEIRGR